MSSKKILSNAIETPLAYFLHTLCSLNFCKQICSWVIDARCPRRLPRPPSPHTRNSTDLGHVHLSLTRLELAFNPVLTRPPPVMRRSLSFIAISLLALLLRRQKWRTQLVSTMMGCVYFLMLWHPTSGRNSEVSIWATTQWFNSF